MKIGHNLLIFLLMDSWADASAGPERVALLPVFMAKSSCEHIFSLYLDDTKESNCGPEGR